MTAGDYLKFLFALLFVLSLMGGLTFLLRRLGYGQTGLLHGRDRHLKIIEVLPIDARHKAVLIQRDDVQHLVILSPQGDLLIESTITPADLPVTEKTK